MSGVRVPCRPPPCFNCGYRDIAANRRPSQIRHSMLAPSGRRQSPVSEELWEAVLGVNLKGAFFCAQAAARQMVKAGMGGRIINIASVDALHPTGALTPYDTSKDGMVMMTKSLAREF